MYNIWPGENCYCHEVEPGAINHCPEHGESECPWNYVNKEVDK